MKTQLRLNSVVPHGVSGPQAGALDLIYSFLLQEFKQDFYNYISINQIGTDINEFVQNEQGKKMHVNIRYPEYDDFEERDSSEKNRIRLEVIHSGLLRIADYDKKFDVDKLEAIKRKILDNKFLFDIPLKMAINKKNKSLKAAIIVRPGVDSFDYFVSAEENGKEKCKGLIYKGITNTSYFAYFFKDSKWKNDNEIIITGKEKQVEVHVFVDKCKIEFVNLTPYPKPPLFEMLRVDISDEDKERAYKDWLHSLPPSHAAIIRNADN